MAPETARIEAFSDGVFAIAITLLILEIKVPGPGAGPLSQLLLHQWPQYLAFLISFAFIGVMWINHHRLFSHIHRADDGLLYWNLVLLLVVCFIPFPTAVLSTFLRTPERRTALLLFNFTIYAWPLLTPPFGGMPSAPASCMTRLHRRRQSSHGNTLSALSPTWCAQ